MHIYKPGDKVRILKAEEHDGTDISHRCTVGEVCEVSRRTDMEGDTEVRTNRGDEYYLRQDAIAPATPSWDNLGEGDVLVNDDRRYDLIVQGTIGKVVLTIDTDGDSDHNSIDELKNGGWRIKDAESDDITEVTLEEVAQKLGISVEKLRIKD